MRHHICQANKILTKIFQDGQYSNYALNGEDPSNMATKIIYGVLEQNTKIEMILSSLCEKKPKNSIAIFLKIGIFCLLYIDNIPKSVIVSECVEAAKMNGKKGNAGFINAILKKVANGEYEPQNTLSYKYSKPESFINKFISEYGEDVAIKTLEQQNEYNEHIRVNQRLSSFDAVKKILDDKKEPYKVSEVNGFVVKNTKIIKNLFNDGIVTFQAPSSIKAVNVLNPKDSSNILDLCSAPGGKAIYMSELCPHSVITACDIYQHRLTLIQKYKDRMHTPNVKAMLMDATKENKDFLGKYDFVLVDAPCSCSGTYLRHPDVFLDKNYEDLTNTVKIQKEIIALAINYVKEGGVLLYSTCSIFKEENRNVVDTILDGNKLDYEEQILPHDEWDGFYIARIIKGGK